MQLVLNSTTVYLLQGDITTIKADAIVNAANSALMGGGGVDGAIHRAGGSLIHKECREIIKKQGSCPTGEAVITAGGNLPAPFVIHTVGPVYRGGADEARLLASCYRNSLALADKNSLSHIVFPSISTGIYAYPVEKAAPAALGAIKEYLEQHVDTIITKVGLILFDQATYASYHTALKQLSK